MNRLRAVMALAITAAAVRLIPLQWLHPLNWDELEFFRCAAWIAEGRVPFRDFWEHHTPLTWFVFAPFAAMTSSPGVSAVIALRWAQVPVWIAIFALINVWMRNAGIERFARWAAMAIALGSSLLMIPAVEFRVDPLAILLYVAGLVLLQRATGRDAFLAGVLFCLCGFANIRMGPLLVVTALVVCLVDTRERTWRAMPRMGLVIAGGLAGLAVCLLYFVATGSLDELYAQTITDNYLADKYSGTSGPMFAHRLLLPFGFRLLGADRLFDFGIIDPGGIAIIVLAVIGFVLVLRATWKAPDDRFVIAFVAAASVGFIAMMKFIYVYHLMACVILVIPLMALVIERMPVRATIAIAAAAWCVNLYGSVLRGKELDLAYQDTVMREAHARSTPRDTSWGGPWAIRREPAYRMWFLHEIARVLVKLDRIEPYRVTNPPASIVYDYHAYLYLMLSQRELAPYLVRHYTPLWRNLWLPGMNAPLPPGVRHQWAVPRDGVYHLFASEAWARHPWFREPLAIAAVEQRNASRLEIHLPAPAAHPELEWWIDGQPATFGATVTLRKGQRIAAANHGALPLGIFLIPGNDAVIFRQPPPGVTLEASSPRVTHWPRFR